MCRGRPYGIAPEVKSHVFREKVRWHMTKEVLVTVRGLQSMDGAANDPVEVIASGDYYQRNGKHYLMFDECMEGDSGITRNMVKLSDGFIEITKKGAVNVHMVFEKGKKNLAGYNTPYGTLMVGIEAENVKLLVSEHQIDACVDYALEVNDRHMADCTIEIRIKSKAEGDSSV